MRRGAEAVASVAATPLQRTAPRRSLWQRNRWLVARRVSQLLVLALFLLGPGDIVPMLAILVWAGSTFGARLFLAPSMQADVIDYDELLSGERRKGLFMGIWAVIRKLAAALGVGVALPLLALAGSLPTQPQTETTRLVLRVLYVGVPVVCNLGAMLIARRYPIDEARHREIRAAIDHEP